MHIVTVYPIILIFQKVSTITTKQIIQIKKMFDFLLSQRKLNSGALIEKKAVVFLLDA